MEYNVEEVINKYPEINIGVLVGKGLTINKKHPELEEYKKVTILNLKNLFSLDSIIKHPYIASWRNMYRSFGTKPADYHPSAEALIRRVLKMGDLPLINTAVDAYNTVSIMHQIPMGGFDLNNVKGNIILRFSKGNEPFIPLGSKDFEYTYDGEVVYSDNQRILTRRWNYRDCDETKITQKTTNLIMFIDGTPEIPQTEIDKALNDLEFHMQKFCDGDYSTNITNKINPVIKIT